MENQFSIFGKFTSPHMTLSTFGTNFSQPKPQKLKMAFYGILTHNCCKISDFPDFFNSPEFFDWSNFKLIPHRETFLIASNLLILLFVPIICYKNEGSNIFITRDMANYAKLLIILILTDFEKIVQNSSLVKVLTSAK